MRYLSHVIKALYIRTIILVAADFLLVFVSCCAQRVPWSQSTGPTAGGVGLWLERNRQFEMDDDSDVSAPDNALQLRCPESLLIVQSALNTSESSELADDAVSFTYNHRVRAQIRKEAQLAAQTAVRAEILEVMQKWREEQQRHAEESLALRQESREERQRHAEESRAQRERHTEEMKAAKAREAALKQMVQVLQANNPESKMQANALRDQTRLAERRRRRCRALRQHWDSSKGCTLRRRRRLYTTIHALY